MLRPISNPAEEKIIELLNQKIADYNQKLTAANPNRKACLQLLQEINHIHMEIKRSALSISLFDSRYPHFKSITEFSGVGEALVHFNLPQVNEASAEAVFIDALRNDHGLPTGKDWESRIESEEKYAEWSLQLPTDFDEELTEDIASLHQMKRQVREGTITSKDYLFALQSFRYKLLDTLCFTPEETSNKKNLRALSREVNGEIQAIKALVPEEVNRQHVVKKVDESLLAQELARLTPEQTKQLIDWLRTPQAISPGPPTKGELVGLLPSLERLDIQKLGGANNTNWKITDHERGLELVLQVGPLTENAKLLARLDNTTVNNHMTPTFFSTLADRNNPYILSLTSYCPGGDLRSERERGYANAPPETILQQGLERAQQITSFCHNMIQQNCVHTDIKLTNFLIDAAGKVTITDKKALLQTDGGKLPRGAYILSTGVFEPPEIRNPDKGADAFMTWQLGLAFYDYLVLPAPPTDSEGTFWSKQIPLDFNKSIFLSEKGLQVKNLLVQMTDPDPGKRPSLEVCKKQMQQIIQSLESKQQCISFKEKYKQLQNESIVSQILTALQTRIEQSSSLEELKQVQKDFHASPEYRSLTLTQDKGIASLVLQMVGITNTNQHLKAMHEMFKTQEKKLSASLNPHP